MRLLSFQILFVVFLLAQSCLGVRASDNSMPVSVEFRRGVLDAHVYVARFENISDKKILLKVMFERADGKSRKSFSLEVEPHQIKELGLHQGGWKGFSGDRLTISSEGYPTFSEQAP